MLGSRTQHAVGPDAQRPALSCPGCTSASGTSCARAFNPVGDCHAGSEGAEYWNGHSWTGPNGEFSYSEYNDGSSYSYGYSYGEVGSSLRPEYCQDAKQ